jgi:c-di-GMP-binding flagellar brake protein YcgR
VKNISPSGCLLVVGSPVGIGSKLNLTIGLFELDGITVRATVYHARKQDAAYYVGLAFEDLREELRHRIIQWIHEVNTEIAEGLML